MKKALSFLLVLVMAISLAACGKLMQTALRLLCQKNMIFAWKS